MPRPRIVVQLRDGIRVTEAVDGGAELHTESGVWSLEDATPATVQALTRLTTGGATHAELAQLTGDAGGTGAGTGELARYVQKLSSLGYVTWSVDDAGQRLARLHVIAPGILLEVPTLEPDAEFVLSRFAYSRPLEHALVIETPLAAVRLELGGWLGGALWSLLARPRDLASLCAAVPGADPDAIRHLVQLLLAARVIHAPGANAEHPQWRFHDLLFHAQVRTGRHDAPVGASELPLAPIPPACKPAMEGEFIALHRPDLEQLVAADLPFTRVLETRRSVRDYAPTPITVSQLGEFLYRAARIKKTYPPDPATGQWAELSIRPSPAGGACHELELYVTVAACEGLTAGIYHYDPQRHGLTRLCAANRYTRAMLSDAQHSTGGRAQPQVLINLTARFARLTWKYNSIAYALALKDVGALYQTMYLVANAMELAPCALGGGHADLLCRAVGLDYLDESPVGEFLLGSKRAADLDPR